MNKTATLNNKIDFAVIFSVKNANPNGDPLNGNRPRSDYEGIGEVTDVCIKRKIRDRLMEAKDEDGNFKHQVFVQSDDRKLDDAKSLKERAEKALGKDINSSKTVELACEKWIDVRAFGQLFAFSGKKSKKDEKVESESGVSIPIRGTVSVHSAFSISPVSITSTQITKSVSGEGGKDGKRGSDTMGMKHRVDQGIYVFFGGINPQLAERTGFSNADANTIKEILPKLFENDASSARPEGSMEVLKVFWWQHNSKPGQYSSAKVHTTLKVNPDGSYELLPLDGLKPEVLTDFDFSKLAAMYSEDDLVMISALQHYAFCPRQCALIHIEQRGEESGLTAEGRLMHERVHEEGNESRGDVRIARGVHLRSLRLGLIGMADVVEFHRVSKSDWQPFPVEYKRGKPKYDHCDAVQLCAQALCLEEMLNVVVPAGALFYGRTRRRSDVDFDETLRRETEEAAARVRALLSNGRTPPAVYEKRCERCSLIGECLPKKMEMKSPVKRYLQRTMEQS